MAKIVKYCSACEESFAEKFSYCPNCAAELSSFEMKPVSQPDEAEAAPEPAKPSLLIGEEPTLEIAEPTNIEPRERISEPEPQVAETVAAPEPPPSVEAPVVSEEVEREELPEAAPTEAFAAADEQIVEAQTPSSPDSEVDSSNGGDSSNKGEDHKVRAEGTFLGLLEVEDRSGDAGTGFKYDPEALKNYNYDSDPHDENYKVTVISERSSSTRNGLLLGTFVVISLTFVGLIIYSLFSYLDDVASLGDDQRLTAMLDDIPVAIEEEQKKADDKAGGGGGGGGKDQDKPVSRGELVTQTRPPLMPPSPTVPKLPNPELPYPMSTEGDNKRDRIEPPGLPDAISSDPSSGPGTGGGMGTGRGTGMGSGFGTGEGSGTGSGSGGGNGDGNGNGTGRGGSPPPRSGPTADIKILSKPRPGYTDEARQNNVRGTVVLRVTFLANGSIGSVSTVRGLPFGLTEKAIAAARRIRFTPPMRNGTPYTVNKVVHFNFTIY